MKYNTDNAFIYVTYKSYKGGTNNLQIAQVLDKTFTSTKMKALDKAKIYLSNLLKSEKCTEKRAINVQN